MVGICYLTCKQLDLCRKYRSVRRPGSMIAFQSPTEFRGFVLIILLVHLLKNKKHNNLGKGAKDMTQRLC